MEADREVLLKLGRLAFEHLEKGNIMFYQEDLEQCGLDVTVGLGEFLAAVYMFHCYTNKERQRWACCKANIVMAERDFQPYLTPPP
ncbi:hypothetical protein L3Q82_000076 [Scortum barcoo]|uniref:Uncharacterized protein n=1 Tax=Scortum barcoo TaxID=214431 RepID=A0ACB8X9L8_9TELE|nr:hypothetical protein L3Q82_000076 [Scortum barcoo]